MKLVILPRKCANRTDIWHELSEANNNLIYDLLSIFFKKTSEKFVSAYKDLIMT